jgi:tyrosyl-tRNA synthetase
LYHCTLLAEEGLEAALKATSALYDQTAESLMALTAEDISKIFEGAKMCELLLQPGTTVLDLAVQAGCFTSESKCNDTAYLMLRKS